MKSITLNHFCTLLIILLNSYVVPLCFGQEYPKKEVNLNEIADALYGFQDLDLNYEELYDNLVQLLAQPIDLNIANAEELRFLKVLSETEVNILLKYRNENGSFLSVYELQSVPGFDFSI